MKLALLQVLLVENCSALVAADSLCSMYSLTSRKLLEQQ